MAVIHKALMQKPAVAAATPLSRLANVLTFAGRLLCAATVAASIAWCLAGWSEVMRPPESPRVTTATVENRIGMMQELASSEWSLTADDRELAVDSADLGTDQMSTGDGEFTVRTFRSAADSAAWLNEPLSIEENAIDSSAATISPSEKELLDLLNDPHVRSVRQRVSNDHPNATENYYATPASHRDIATTHTGAQKSDRQTWRIEQQFGVGVWHTETRQNVQRLCCFRGLTRLGLVAVGIEWRSAAQTVGGSQSHSDSSASKHASLATRPMPGRSRRVAVRYDRQNKTTCELWLTDANSSDLTATWLAAGWLQVGLPVPSSSAVAARASGSFASSTAGSPNSNATAPGSYAAGSGVESLAFSRGNVRLQLVSLEPDQAPASDRREPPGSDATAATDRPSRLVLLLIETDS